MDLHAVLDNQLDTMPAGCENPMAGVLQEDFAGEEEAIDVLSSLFRHTSSSTLFSSLPSNGIWPGPAVMSTSWGAAPLALEVYLGLAADADSGLPPDPGLHIPEPTIGTPTGPSTTAEVYRGLFTLTRVGTMIAKSVRAVVSQNAALSAASASGFSMTELSAITASTAPKWWKAVPALSRFNRCFYRNGKYELHVVYGFLVKSKQHPEVPLPECSGITRGNLSEILIASGSQLVVPHELWVDACVMLGLDSVGRNVDSVSREDVKKRPAAVTKLVNTARMRVRDILYVSRASGGVPGALLEVVMAALHRVLRWAIDADHAVGKKRARVNPRTIPRMAGPPVDATNLHDTLVALKIGGFSSAVLPSGESVSGSSTLYVDVVAGSIPLFLHRFAMEHHVQLSLRRGHFRTVRGEYLLTYECVRSGSHLTAVAQPNVSYMWNGNLRLKPTRQYSHPVGVGCPFSLRICVPTNKGLDGIDPSQVLRIEMPMGPTYHCGHRPGPEGMSLCDVGESDYDYFSLHPVAEVELQRLYADGAGMGWGIEIAAQMNCFLAKLRPQFQKDPVTCCPAGSPVSVGHEDIPRMADDLQAQKSTDVILGQLNLPRVFSPYRWTVTAEYVQDRFHHFRRTQRKGSPAIEHTFRRLQEVYVPQGLCWFTRRNSPKEPAMVDVVICFAAPSYLDAVQQLASHPGCIALALDATYKTTSLNMPLYNLVAVDPLSRQAMPLLHAVALTVTRQEAEQVTAGVADMPSPAGAGLKEDKEEDEGSGLEAFIVATMLLRASHMGLSRWSVLLMDHSKAQWRAVRQLVLDDLSRFLDKAVVPALSKLKELLATVPVPPEALALAEVWLEQGRVEADANLPLDSSPAPAQQLKELIATGEEFFCPTFWKAATEAACGATIAPAIMSLLGRDLGALSSPRAAEDTFLGQHHTFLDRLLRRWGRVAKVGSVFASLLRDHCQRRTWLCQFHVLQDWQKQLKSKCAELHAALGPRPSETALKALPEALAFIYGGKGELSLDLLWRFVFLSLHRIMYAKTATVFNELWKDFSKLRPVWPSGMNYLEKYYVNSKYQPLWAMHCRAGIPHMEQDTTNKVEVLHRIMKHSFLKGQPSKDPLRVVTALVGDPSSEELTARSFAFNMYINIRAKRREYSTPASEDAKKMAAQAGWMLADLHAGHTTSKVTVPAGSGPTHQVVTLHFEGMKQLYEARKKDPDNKGFASGRRMGAAAASASTDPSCNEDSKANRMDSWLRQKEMEEEGNKLASVRASLFIVDLQARTCSCVRQKAVCYHLIAVQVYARDVLKWPTLWNDDFDHIVDAKQIQNEILKFESPHAAAGELFGQAFASGIKRGREQNVTGPSGTTAGVVAAIPHSKSTTQGSKAIRLYIHKAAQQSSVGRAAVGSPATGSPNVLVVESNPAPHKVQSPAEIFLQEMDVVERPHWVPIVRCMAGCPPLRRFIQEYGHDASSEPVRACLRALMQLPQHGAPQRLLSFAALDAACADDGSPIVTPLAHVAARVHAVLCTLARQSVYSHLCGFHLLRRDAVPCSCPTNVSEYLTDPIHMLTVEVSADGLLPAVKRSVAGLAGAIPPRPPCSCTRLLGSVSILDSEQLPELLAIAVQRPVDPVKSPITFDLDVSSVSGLWDGDALYHLHSFLVGDHVYARETIPGTWSHITGATSEQISTSIVAEEVGEAELLLYARHGTTSLGLSTDSNDSSAVAANAFGIQVQQDQIQQIRSPRGWLNDDTITMFGFQCLQMLSETSDPGTLLTVRVLHTFFWPSLHIDVPTNQRYNLARVTRVSVDKHFSCAPLSSLETIIIPVNKNSNHWVVCILYPQQRVVHYLDSLYAGDAEKFGSAVIDGCLAWYSHATSDAPGPEISSSWTRRIGNCPQQTNGYDCGVFACLFIMYAIFLGDTGPKSLNFGNDDIPQARQLISQTILQGTWPSFHSCRGPWSKAFLIARMNNARKASSSQSGHLPA